MKCITHLLKVKPGLLIITIVCCCFVFCVAKRRQKGKDRKEIEKYLYQGETINNILTGFYIPLIFLLFSNTKKNIEIAFICGVCVFAIVITLQIILYGYKKTLMYWNDENYTINQKEGNKKKYIVVIEEKDNI